MQVLKRANRLYDTSRFEYPAIRIYHQAAKMKRSPRYLLKCGCCEEKIAVYYDEDGLEIGGVNGTIDDWREILLPLLLFKRTPQGLIDIRKKKAGVKTLKKQAR
ncbi:MAG: hypothetical protein ABIF71_10740 [Planctomycetota bacterium]